MYALGGFMERDLGYTFSFGEILVLYKRALDSSEEWRDKRYGLSGLRFFYKLSDTEAQEILAYGICSLDSLRSCTELAQALKIEPNVSRMRSASTVDPETFDHRLRCLQARELYHSTYMHSKVRDDPIKESMYFCGSDFTTWPREEQIALYSGLSKKADRWLTKELREASGTRVPQDIVNESFQLLLERIEAGKVEEGTVTSSILGKADIFNAGPSPEIGEKLLLEMLADYAGPHVDKFADITGELSKTLRLMEIEAYPEEIIQQSYQLLFELGSQSYSQRNQAEIAIHLLFRISGHPPSDELLIKYVLRRHEIPYSCPYLSLPSEVLNEHFSHSENQRYAEICIVGAALDSDDYFEQVASRLARTADQRQELDGSTTSNEHDLEYYVNLSLYLATRARGVDYKSDREMVDVAMSLIANYGTEPTHHSFLANTLIDVAQVSVEANDMNVYQSGIITRLLKRQHSESFSMTNEEHIALLYFFQGGHDHHADGFALLSRLLMLAISQDEKLGLFEMYHKAYLASDYPSLGIYLQDQIQAQGDAFDWSEMEYIYGYTSHPNKSLHGLARQNLRYFPVSYLEGQSISEYLKQLPGIPSSLALPLMGVCFSHTFRADYAQYRESWATGLQRLSELYSLCRGKKDREDLDWALLNAAYGPTCNTFLRGMFERGARTQEDLAVFTETLRLVEAYERFSETMADLDGQPLDRLLTFTDRDSLVEYCLPIKEHIVLKVKSLLGLDDISDEHVYTIVTQWYSIEPLLTYGKVIRGEKEVYDFFFNYSTKVGSS
ncbi:MAG: hypothetical protein UZ21_OP11001000960 [Microgenomates bacterium OLB22]|nr:MAG: hypothetical protein UZ21_OP11001000960 [Microgenomates bacterium OLB22]